MGVLNIMKLLACVHPCSRAPPSRIQYIRSLVDLLHLRRSWHRARPRGYVGARKSPPLYTSNSQHPRLVRTYRTGTFEKFERGINLRAIRAISHTCAPQFGRCHRRYHVQRPKLLRCLQQLLQCEYGLQIYMYMHKHAWRPAAAHNEGPRIHAQQTGQRRQCVDRECRYSDFTFVSVHSAVVHQY